LFGFVLPDSLLAVSAFHCCSFAVIFLPFPANAPRVTAPAEKEYVRQFHTEIAPKTPRRIQLVEVQESSLFPLPRARAPRRWPKFDLKGSLLPFARISSSCFERIGKPRNFLQMLLSRQGMMLESSAMFRSPLRGGCIYHPKNRSRKTVKMANCIKPMRVVSMEGFTLLVKCGAVTRSSETRLASPPALLGTSPSNGRYVDQKQQVSFRFAEMASWRVSGSSFRPKAVEVSRTAPNYRL
jgi:hypothetical protein